MAALVGKQYAPATLVRYTTTLKHTQAFLQWKYRLNDIDIKKLNYEFITEFEFWFKTVRNCDHNTTIKYLSNVRKIINRAIKHGWLEKDPFFGFVMTKKDVDRIPLNDYDLECIRNKTLSIKRLELVRDIFLFSCFTGLAYIDVKNLKNSDVSIGVDGERWLFVNRQKTTNASRVPLVPAAARILEKYKPQIVEPSQPCLPALSNQKMNAYLKEIADLCGIEKRLTFHISRHTFATTVTLNNGVPIETVSKMLGHKDIRSTQLYAKIIDTKTSNDMKKIKMRYQ
jgi:site-specific recombinase XerD